MGDRWFCQRYCHMVDDDTVQIEARELHSAHSGFERGHLRMWVDVLTQKQSQERRPTLLPSTEPLPFHLRVVIWRVSRVDVRDGIPDLFISGRHTLDDGEIITDETDTHYGAEDGVGTYNWRLIFRILVPCRDPRLELRLQNDYKIGSDEVLAELTLDLSKDLQTARKTNCTIEIKRDHVAMTHPAFPGEVRAMLDLEAKLLPEDEALIRDAGRGHDEPNEEPFLDANDPHRMAHRNFLATRQVVKLAGDIGGAIFSGLKWTTYLYIGGSVLSTIFFCTFSAIMLTK